MTKKIDLLEFATNSEQPSLEPVRLGENETAFVPFTSETEEVYLHYCSEPDINGYIQCNGDDCVLCRIGRKTDHRLLLPVYLPADSTIGILPVSPSLRPYALLPQIAPTLKAEKTMVIFVTRENAKFLISTVELKDDVDGGEGEIKRFLDEYNKGVFRLSAVYQHIENEQLKSIPAISKMLQLKGQK
jgi:hypothetical protein